MKNNLLLFLIFLLVNINGFSTDNHKQEGWCGSVAPDMEWENQLQRIIHNQQLQNGTNRQQQTSYVIPVVVHVIWWTTAQNISATQVQSQITVLNNDFAGIGLNSGTIPAPFASLKANSNITFCLAKLDPNNNVMAEPGIDRVSAQAKNWLNPGTQGWEKTYIDGTIKPATIWNPNFYLNVWVVKGIKNPAGSTSTGIILGYATFPGLTGLAGMPTGTGNELNDGFVCRGDYFGTTGSANGTYGRTATHEIGHWLGLRHIWGDNGQCNGDDYCNDTPKAYGGTASPAGCNYGCPTFPAHPNLCNSNPNGDMFMNFMDYTNDNCMSMFTNDQSTRFQTTMQFGDFRKNIPLSPACDTVKQKPYPNFTSLKAVAALCATSQTFSFTDKSLFAPTSWSWTFQGGTPSTSNIKNPTNIVFNTAGLHDVTLTATNSRGSSSITIQVNVPIIGNGTLPLAEGFEGAVFPPLGWDFVNRNGNPAINWDVITGYSAYGVGNKAMRFDNTSLDGAFKKDDIMTSKLNFTGVTQATLKFDVSHAPYYGPLTTGGPDEHLWDTLEVLITDNCQTTTQRLYRKGDSILATVMPGQGDEFYPAPNQWRTDSVAIPAGYLNKPNVQIIFRNYGDYGHTIYIDNINISIPNASPTATASFTASDTTVCIGGSLTFTNTSTASSGSPDSVRWTIPGGTPSTSTSTTTVTPTFSTAGTYIISLVAYKSGNASAAFTKSIRVKSKPTVGVNSPTICSGQTASLTGTGATTYTWTGGLSGSPTAITPALTTTTTYTVTGTTQGCTNTAVATVTVNPSPTVGVNSPTICSGQTASLTGTGATTYTWTGGLSGSPTAVTPALTTTTTYTVTGTLNGCPGTAVATVSVTPLPNVSVNSPGICNGQTAVLTASGATSYLWNTSATGPTISVSPTSTTTYTVTGTTGICSKTVTSTVAVTNVPTVIVNSPTICAGQTASLTASGATSYTWTGGLSGIPTVVTPVLSTTTTYTVTGTTSGCSSTAVSTVTVNPSPTINVNSPTICAGQTASLTATGATSYIWTGGLAAISNPTTPVLSNTTTYTVTGTLNGCPGSAVSTVSVTQLPNVTVTSPSICSGSTATLQASGATSYTWTGGLSPVSNPTTPTLTTTTTYTVTGTTGLCSKTAVSTVSVNSTTPTVTITPNPASICIGDAITLTGNGANNYTWTNSQTGTTIGGTLTFTPAGDITVNLSGTVTGCTAAGTSSIGVTVKPKPTVGVSSPSICSGQTAQPIASGAVGYIWTGGLAAVSNPTTPALTTTTTYTVTGMTNGCTNTAVSTVSVTTTPITPTITQSHDTLNSSTIVVGGTYKWYLGATLVATTTDPYFKFTTAGSYTVTVTKTDCTSAASPAFPASSTGVRNTSNSVKLFEVYPNPTEGRLVINLNLYKTSSVNISIYTPEGREVYVKAYGNTRALTEELNINEFAKGVYIIKLRVDEETYYHKVVKN